MKRRRRLRIRRNPLPLLAGLPAVAQVAVVGAGAVAAAHVAKNHGLHLGWAQPNNPHSANDPYAVKHPPSNVPPPEDTRHTSLGPA